MEDRSIATQRYDQVDLFCVGPCRTLSADALAIAVGELDLVAIPRLQQGCRAYLRGRRVLGDTFVEYICEA